MTRKSKRELERGLDDLQGDDPDVVGLLTVMSTLHNDGDVTRVPGRRGLVRVDGEVKRLTRNAREKLAGWSS